MTTTDAVNKAKAGQNDGFTYLYERCNKKCYYTALKFMKNDTLAEDMMQEAFIKAFEKIDTLEDSSKFESWLCQITARLCLNELKKNSPLLFSETETEDGADIADTFYDDRVYNNPEVSLDKKETSRLVNEMLKDLSEEQRICVTLFYADDMSVKDIAASLDVSENTVKSRLNYARKHIKEKVLELEKKGTKLYGLAPIPLLMLLLKEDAKACEINLSAASFLAKTNLGATKTLGAKIAAATVTQKVIAGVVAGAVVVGAGVGAHSALSNKVTFADDYVSPEVLFIDFYDTEKPVAFSNGVTISKYADDDDYMYYFNILFTSDYESLDTYYPGDGYTFLDITTRSEDYTYQKGKLYAKAYNDTIFLVGENASGTKSPLYMVSDANEISPINYVFDYDPGTEGLVSNLLDETDYDLSSWVELYSAIDGYSNTNPNDAYSAYKTSNDELVALILATNETIAEEDADTDEPVTDLTEDVTDNDTIDTNDANNTNNTNDTIEMVSDTSSYIEIGGVYSSSLTINIYSDYDPDYIGNVYYNDSELGELKDLGSNIYSVENYDTKADTGYRLVVMSDNSINLFKDGEYVGNCTLKQRLYS